jgi:EAL domain-containing protein (putative c-di-GMP-specific phosphodiesterase class I)
LQDFTVKAKITKQKLKILFRRYGQRAGLKTALDDFGAGYLVNNGYK